MEARLKIRSVTSDDIYRVIELAGKGPMTREESLFFDHRKLRSAIHAENSLWFLAEDQHSNHSVMISGLVDEIQGVCKITHLLVDSEREGWQEDLRDGIAIFLDHVAIEYPDLYVIYTTTTSLSPAEQEITLEAGFKIFGVFPNLLGQDNSQLNGLTAFYLKDALSKKRQGQITIHPVIEPFFRIAQRQVALSNPEIATDDQVQELMSELEKNLPKESQEKLTLELIEAPAFVDNRFSHHMEKLSQMISFYPFYRPNAIITSPNQEIEVFVRLAPQMRFAAVIGEYLGVPVSPVGLYEAVQNLLRDKGISYIEIINDSEDLVGSECMLRSGFTPSAYFPAFKRQGPSRRDFVVFGKSFEYVCRPDTSTKRAFFDFYREYIRIESQQYFPPGFLVD